MTPKETKDREQLIQLEKENALLKEQVAGLTKRIGELESQKPASKSRMQATELMHMLAEGPVSVDKLVKLNPKYPSDAVYYARTLLKADIKLVRRGGGLPNVYMLAKDFQTYSEGLKKEKAAQEASKQEAKEELTPAPTQAVSATAGHAAV